MAPPQTAGRIGGEKHFRRDLAEAVDDALRAEIRRARRPQRTERSRREHRDDGSGMFGRNPAMRSPMPHAGLLQRVRKAADFVVQFGVSSSRLCPHSLRATIATRSSL